MDELIDYDTKQWNRDLIFHSFNNYAAHQIIKIPLSMRQPEDKIIWHWEKDGIYSVRSAHHALCDENFSNQPESSSANNPVIWKQIWNTPASRSVQNFLWRLPKDILPTRSNLGKKGTSLDMNCPICHVGIENRDHLFKNY